MAKWVDAALLWLLTGRGGGPAGQAAARCRQSAERRLRKAGVGAGQCRMRAAPTRPPAARAGGTCFRFRHASASGMLSLPACLPFIGWATASRRGGARRGERRHAFDGILMAAHQSIK